MAGDSKIAVVEIYQVQRKSPPRRAGHYWFGFICRYASRAQAVCVDTPANATCGPGNYPAGISYDVDGDFTIRVESGAVIGRSDVTSDQDGVHLDGDAPGHLQVILENGVTISTLPEGGDGVQVHATSAGGSVEIVSGANITISTNIDGDPAEFDNSGLLGWVDAGEGYIAITQNAGSSWRSLRRPPLRRHGW